MEPMEVDSLKRVGPLVVGTKVSHRPALLPFPVVGQGDFNRYPRRAGFEHRGAGLGNQSPQRRLYLLPNRVNHRLPDNQTHVRNLNVYFIVGVVLCQPRPEPHHVSNVFRYADFRFSAVVVNQSTGEIIVVSIHRKVINFLTGNRFDGNKLITFTRGGVLICRLEVTTAFHRRLWIVSVE